MTGLARQVTVLAAAAVNLTLNGLAGAGVLFGTQTGAVSDAVPTGVTPAGWAFSVWSVIFVGVLVFAVFQARPSARGPRYDAPAAPFALANVLNGLWQIPWLLGQFAVSAVVIAGILGSLVWLYVVLDRMELRGTERWALGVPASLFLGWVAVATALNISVGLAAAGWSAPGVWPLVVVGLLGAVGVSLLLRTGDVALAAVLMWAFVGIIAAQSGNAPLLILLIGLVVAFGLTLAVFGRRHGPWLGTSPSPAL